MPMVSNLSYFPALGHNCPDSVLVIVCNRKGEIEILDTSSESLEENLDGEDSLILGISPDGAQVEP